ncbi:hypothetical protein OC846_000759 [Tilletia horrida]|uniref:SGNH hydrolase-type esterase domain-containing protein n=1 Tax=Tilletia horrida TaxID=155126 RepID=A0AAN6JTN7_9BASI|nr:hypothetical protein OC846_000759 [Tilletia horrida]
MRFSNTLLAAAALLFPALVGASPLSGLKHKFGQVVVVGDSLSDNGNVYRFTNHTWPADPAYYKGRFSNGPVWVEYLARDIGPHAGGAPLIDLAYGGATVNNTRIQGYTGPNSTIPVPSVLDQISAYLKTAKAGEVHSSLFVVTGGANDAFFGLGGAYSPSELAKLVAADLITAAHRLYKAGARHFLIPSPPALQTIPYAQDFSISSQPSLKGFSDTFVSYLRANAIKVGKEATVTIFDQVKAFDSYISEKSKRKGWHVKDACLVGVYGETKTRTLCADPDKFVFWDIYHPTTKTHRYLARRALKALHHNALSEHKH